MMTFDIEGFEILGKIGQGGMASVWKARQLSLDRIVAIKVLSEVFSNEPDDIRRFQDEAQAAAKLKHPGIVQVHDAKAENGIYYFIMEYVSGYTVGDWVRRKGVLSEKDALLVVDCVADALEYAWDHARIVHCDIKPDNIIIDEDGTVKVADLGLARTISMMDVGGEQLEEIMGTPAYISPEQANGETNLDFRSDIYSLGAMLYHLVTGKMMFEEFDDDVKLEKHITDTVEDPIDLNPHLSKGICWLIERMTAKDPDLRQSSWGAVRSDIRRVQHGHLPHGELLPEGSSTVRRSSRRTVADYDIISAMQERDKKVAKRSMVRTTLVTAVVAVAIAFAIKLYIEHAETPLRPMPVKVVEKETGAEADKPVNPPAKPPPGSGGVGTPRVAGGSEAAGGATPAPHDNNPSDLARELFEFAKDWSREHPDDYDTAIEQFKTVEEQTRGTKYSLMAQQEIRRLEQARQAAVSRVISGMTGKVKRLVADHRFDDAINLLASYNGPFASDTADRRRAAVAVIVRRKQVWQQQRKLRAKELEKERQQQIDRLVMAVLANDLEMAVEKVNAMLGNEAFAGMDKDLKAIRKVLQDAMNINDRVLDSFRRQVGQTVDVYLKRGLRTLTISDVSGNQIECRQQLSVGHGGVSIIKIGVGDLTDYERLRRMGKDSDYAVALVKGIMAYQSAAYTPAEKYLGSTQPLLARYLVARLKGGLSTDIEKGMDEHMPDISNDGSDKISNNGAQDTDSGRKFVPHRRPRQNYFPPKRKKFEPRGLRRPPKRIHEIETDFDEEENQ